MIFGMSRTARLMCFILICLCIVFSVAGLLINAFVYPFEPPAAYITGLLAGTALSIAKVKMMERSLNRIADMENSKNAQSYGALQSIFRNLLTLGLLALVFFFRDIFGLFGTIISVLYMQIAAYIAGYLLRKDKKRL